MKPTLIAIFAFFAVAAPRSARAQLQTVSPSTGPEVFPGRVQISLKPLGFQTLFAEKGAATTIYKLTLALAARTLSLEKGTLWIGGELNFAGAPLPGNNSGQLAVFEPGLFALLTFEKAVNVPIVPFFKGGFSFGVLSVYDIPMAPSATYGAFWPKIGGGFHGFPVKNVGIGLEADLGLGTTIVARGGSSYGAFYGYFDLLAGLDFAF